MWNLTFSNRRCNEYDKIKVKFITLIWNKEHKLHLERVITIKPRIILKEPLIPSFLLNKSKKEKVSQKQSMFAINIFKLVEINRKVGYENRVLLKKIIDIENKNSAYHPCNVQVKYCPAFEKKSYTKNFHKSLLKKENIVSCVK